MSIKTFIIAAAVAVGTFGLSDRADAQWRRYSGYNTYSYPSYSYNYPTYSTYSYPGYSSYVYPSTYNTSGVVTSGYTPYYNNSGVVTSGYSTPYYGTYSTPYSNSYYGNNYYGSGYNGTGYMDPYSAGLYNSYYSGYSNLGGNPYGLSVGTNGGMIGGRRAWRW